VNIVKSIVVRNGVDSFGQVVKHFNKFNKMNAIIPALISIDTGDSTWGNISDFTKSLLIDYSVNDRGLPGSIATAIRLHFDSTFVYDEPI